MNLEEEKWYLFPNGMPVKACRGCDKWWTLYTEEEWYSFSTGSYEIDPSGKIMRFRKPIGLTADDLVEDEEVKPPTHSSNIVEVSHAHQARSRYFKTAPRM